MGCCFSDESSETETDPGENSRLLPEVARDDHPNRTAHNSYESNAPVVHPKTDEASAINKILTSTASNVIDVAQLDSQTMEQHEYMDRARAYTNRLAQQCVGSDSLRNRCSVSLPAGVSSPQAVLSAPTLSSSDISFITQAVTQASKIVKDIKVRHKEDLVVPFGVP